MRIVHSLWSKPAQKRRDMGLESNCGWPDRRYNYFSWILSVMQFRKFYDEIELVTDKAGYELLIGKLGLPYTNVRVVLDDLNHYHPDLWAIGKLYAYSIQKEPFIHADGDVYIWKKFDAELESAPLLCQRKEEGDHYNAFYLRSFGPIMEKFDFYPEVLYKSLNKNNGIKAICAGIIGGHNLDLFKLYTDMAFEFVDRNVRHLDKIDTSNANIVFEQFLFSALCEERGEEITYFNPFAHDLINDFADYTGIPAKTKFIHTPGAFKRDLFIAESLEYRLHTDYPEYYDRVIHLIKTNKI